MPSPYIRSQFFQRGASRGFLVIFVSTGTFSYLPFSAFAQNESNI